MQLRNRLSVALCSVILLHPYFLPATAAPRPAPVSGQWLQSKGARKEGPTDEAGLPGGPAILWLDEATRARNGAKGGSAASTGLAEALIFHQPHDSGFGYFNKSDDTFGLGTWANRMVFGNGWRPGDSISSYEARIIHGPYDDPGLGGADFMIELWDGDPMGIIETVCSTAGIPAPIPGTRGFITDVPHGALIQARVELSEKVTYDCDRAWMVTTILSGCRAAWRISGYPSATSPPLRPPPGIGESDSIWMQWACEQMGSPLFGQGCSIEPPGTETFCCGTEVSCDRESPPEESACAGIPEPAIAATFCGDGRVDYFTTPENSDPAGAEESGFVGSIFAATLSYMRIVPVSVDAPPSAGRSGSGVVSISRDEVVLQDGDHNVWLEIMIGDWSPDTLVQYIPALDMQQSVCSGSGDRCFQFLPNPCPTGETCDAVSGSFVSGLQGQLEIFTGGFPCGECEDNAAPCYGNAECTFGECSGSGDPCHLTSECALDETCDGATLCAASTNSYAACEAALGRGSFCGPAGYLLGTASGTCSWTHIDGTDPRSAFGGHWYPALDVSTYDARPSYAIVFGPPAAPNPFPAEGLYGATLAIHVPSDAKGTFTIALKPFPESMLIGGSTALIPLVGTIPAKITIQTGRCCYNLQNLKSTGADCLDELQTAESCSQFPGLTMFTPGETCDGPSFGCGCDPSEPATFVDGDACTDDFCADGVPIHTHRVCDDGLICTDDDCDSDDTDGDGEGCYFTDVDVEDGLGCTVDSCNESDGIVHVPVDTDDGDPCTVDVCLEPDGLIIYQDLTTAPNSYSCPTGDPVADGCPSEASVCLSGYCLCFPCGDDFIDPGEMCDGSDDAACFGRCRSDCQCPTCGDGVLDEGEECDAGTPGTAVADDACPGQCQSDCTCPSTIPAASHWGLTALALLLLTGAKLYRWRLVT